MKTIKITTAIAILFMIPVITLAQSPATKIYEKYAGQEGFTSVNISKELFQMMMKMEIKGEGTEQAQEMQNMMEQLEGLKILTFEDTLHKTKAKELFREFNDLFPSGVYTEMMAIKENGNNIRFLVKETSAGKIGELVMIAEDESEVTLLSLMGNIDMSTISKISSTMNIQGMENLKKMKEKK